MASVPLRSPFGRTVGIAAIFLLVGFLIVPQGVHADACGTHTITGTFFTLYESSEYSPSGYLQIHFRNSRSDQYFGFGWNMYNDTCGSLPPVQSWNQYNFQLTLPAGVTQWSARFTSMSHFDIWDDQNEKIVRSVDMGGLILPDYSSIAFHGTISPGNNLDTFTARGLKIKQDAVALVVENRVEIPPGCPAGAGSGFFDTSYQRAEYVDGLLRVHLRYDGNYAGASFHSTVVPLTDPCVINPDNEPAYFSMPYTNFSMSNFYLRYFSLRFTSPTHYIFWDDERDVQVQCDGCQGDLQGEVKYVYWRAVDGSGVNKLRTSPLPPTEPVTTLTPVIIIPGILGSAQHNGEWFIDPITHTYDNLIDTLAANGYEKNVTLFTFPYDWHKSNVDTAVLLNQKIDEIKLICNCDEIDLVAHSMGGLVARQYIQSSVYDHDVRKLVFLGTPQLGAPNAYLMWEGGEVGPLLNVQSTLLKIFLTQEAHENGYSNLFSYIQNKPIVSVRELLPTYDYIFDGADLRNYPNNYPTNPFLESLNNNVTSLLNSGADIFNIVGNTGTQSTITSIDATTTPQFFPKWPNGYPVGFYNLFGDHGLEWGSGDGTVPYLSASFIQSNLSIVQIAHRSLPSAEANMVFQIITGHEPQSTTVSGTIPTLLVIKVLSPADISVVSPDGKRIGKDFSTEQEFNEIPNAFYTGYHTDYEFITIPNPLDGQYKIVTQGTGSGGEYTLATGVITDSTSIETFFSGQTLPNLVTEHDVNIDTNNPGDIEIVPSDQTSPTISVIQPATTTYAHSDFMPVNVTFTDETGVATSGIEFDGVPVAASSTIDLFFQALGAHAFTASATDLVNNATSSTKTIQVVATYDSTVSDVNRAFDLGWILKSAVKDDLLKKLRRAVTIKKKIDTITVSIKPKVEKRVERLEKQIDKVLLRALVKDVQQAHERRKINDQAFQLLSADLNWLINN